MSGNDANAQAEQSGVMAYRDPSLDTIEQVMEGLHRVGSVEAVYGAPVKQRDVVIIPAAEVFAASGFGLGQGFGGPEGESGASGAGGGGGGGGSAHARPVAVIVVSAEGVRVEPVLDITKIALAGVTFAAFAAGMLARIGQAKRAFAKMSKAIE